MKIVCAECGRFIRYEEPFNLNSTQEEACETGESCPFQLRIARLLLDNGTLPNAHLGIKKVAREEVIVAR